MTEINFQPVFEHIDKSTQLLKEEILYVVRSEARNDLREIRTDIANLSGQVKDFTDEMHVSNYRVTRLEEWQSQWAKKQVCH